jgi:hypothetical protein
MSHQSQQYDHVKTPEWLMTMFRGFFDPYPLGCLSPLQPPTGVRIFANPGYSRSDEAVEDCIRWHQQGYYVVMLIPFESSTRRGKRLIQYGCNRIYFEKRVFEGVRNVELIVLTGESK